MEKKTDYATAAYLWAFTSERAHDWHAANSKAVWGAYIRPQVDQIRGGDELAEAILQRSKPLDWVENTVHFCLRRRMYALSTGLRAGPLLT